MESEPCLCVCVPSYRERERETDRQTDRQTYRETDRQRGREREREREREGGGEERERRGGCKFSWNHKKRYTKNPSRLCFQCCARWASLPAQ